MYRVQFNKYFCFFKNAEPYTSIMHSVVRDCPVPKEEPTDTLIIQPGGRRELLRRTGLTGLANGQASEEEFREKGSHARRYYRLRQFRGCLRLWAVRIRRERRTKYPKKFRVRMGPYRFPCPTSLPSAIFWIVSSRHPFPFTIPCERGSSAKVIPLRLKATGMQATPLASRRTNSRRTCHRNDCG